MKKLITILVFLITCSASAQLQSVTGPTDGVLLRPSTSTQLNALQNPTEGLLVSNTTTKSLWYYNGTEFIDLMAIIGTGTAGTAQTYTAGTGLTLTANQFSVTNPFEAADETKLDGIEANAAANQSLSITGQNLSISGGNSVTLPTGGTTDPEVVTFGKSVNEQNAGTTARPQWSMIQRGFPANGIPKLTFEYGNLFLSNGLSTDFHDFDNALTVQPAGVSITRGTKTFNFTENYNTDSSVPTKADVDAAIAAITAGGTIPDNAVTTSNITNGTILEEDLSSAVVTKLNATGGGISWSTPIDSNVVPSTDNTYDIGTEVNRIRTLYTTNTFSNSLDAGQVETNLLRLVESGGGGFRDVRNLNGTLQFQNSTGVWTDFESSSGMTAAQITLEANRALPPFRVALPATSTLSRAGLTVSSGTQLIGRRTYRSASINSNLTLQSDFVVDDIVLMETIGTGQINLIPPSGESFLINGVPTAAGVTLTGNYALHSARKVAASLWEVSSNDVVAFAPAPSNLYQEASGANGTNNAALLGSWVPQAGGSGVVVTDAAAVGGRAIRADKNGVNNNFAGLNLDMGSNAIVSTWSGGLITTGLELGATYTVTVDLKMSSAGNSPYYAFRFNSSNISEGFITGLNATTYTTRSFQLVIPSTGTHQIGNGFRLLPNTNGGQVGTLDIANLRITRN